VVSAGSIDSELAAGSPMDIGPAGLFTKSETEGDMLADSEAGTDSNVGSGAAVDPCADSAAATNPHPATETAVESLTGLGNAPFSDL